MVNSRRSVNLPAPCFNQYNVPVLRSPAHSVRSDFARFVAQKFGRGPFLVVAPEQAELKQQFEDVGIEATVCASAAELASKVPQNGSGPPADLAIWFYPPDKSHDERAVEDIALRAREVLLVSGVGAEIANRRPHLVERFGRFGLLPDYECDLEDLEPTSLRLVRKTEEFAETMVPAVESAFSRLNRYVRGLQRPCRHRVQNSGCGSPYREARRKLLKLKEAKQQLRQLKQESRHCANRGTQDRPGFLAPYRLPQRLLREFRKRFPQH